MHTIFLTRLFNQAHLKGMKLGLENISKLDELFGFPSRSFSCIHVGGTNGKGSVTTKMAHSLQVEGRKVGLYTSPHISSFRERIQVNGKMISLSQAEELAAKIFEKVDEAKISPTFFELITILAFIYFAQEKVDVAVLEVGMGGRLDATNIVTPLLSIITSIDFDHTQHLGKTLDEIASEKAGIIKPGIPVIVGPSARIPIIKEIALQRHSPYSEIEERGEDFEKENRMIAQKALSLLPFKSFDANGLNVTPPCRFEVFQDRVPIILDVAHNPAGLKALFKRLESTFSAKKVRVLLGFSVDKDIEESFKFLSGKTSHIHLCQARIERAAPTSMLAGILRKLGNDCFSEEISVRDGFERAKVVAKSDEVILVTGSFYIMGDVRVCLNLQESQDLFLTPY